MDDLEGLRATKRFKTKVRALEQNLPVVELLAFLKEHSEAALYEKMSQLVNEATIRMKVTFTAATASLALSQIKPEEKLCTISLTGAERDKDKGGKISESYPDKLTVSIKGGKQTGQFIAFIRHGLVVPWFNQEVRING